MYGINPQEIQNAQTVLGQTQAQMAALPQAMQQMGNGRLTGAQEAIRMNTAQGNAQQALTDQTNTLSNLQGFAQLAQTGANQQTGFAGQSQSMQLGALQNVFQDALSKQQAAQSQVQYFQTLAQQGYNVTAQLEGAQAQLNQAQATFAQASATVQAAQIQAAPGMGQLALAQEEAAKGDKNTGYVMAPNPNGTPGFQYTYNGTPITVQQYDVGNKSNVSPLAGLPIPQNTNSTSSSFANGVPSFGGASILNRGY
jgi:hypothetical protein